MSLNKTNNMKKAIIFYALVFACVVTTVSVPSFWSYVVLVLSLLGLASWCSLMTKEELYAVSGAYLFNEILKTSDFTQE